MKPHAAENAELPRRGRLFGWARSIFARVNRNRLLEIDRAEFEQVARDLDLSNPELYGLLTGRRVSAELLERKWASVASAPKRITKARVAEVRSPEADQISAQVQAWLPIGPSCC